MDRIDVHVRSLLGEIGAKDVDPAKAMARYYVLEFLTSFNDEDPDVKYFAKVAADTLAALVATLDPIFRTYALGAIGGELRHHFGIRGNRIMPSGRGSGSDWFYAMAEEHGRAVLVNDAMALFADDAWEHGYGGSSWHACAKVLHARETGKLSPALFVDRVFSLQHNNGSFLNKFAWATANELSWDTDCMQAVGEAHAARDTDWGLLLRLAGSDVRSLFASARKARNVARRHLRVPLEVVPTALPMDYYVAQAIAESDRLAKLATDIAATTGVKL